jgi:DNA-binding transcriptional LysR family regulator
VELFVDLHKLPNLDFRLLVVFDEIRRHRSLTQAAQSLGMTQPAISKSLQRLRRELGDQLFIRTANGMEATPRAISLNAPVADILRAYYERIAVAPMFDPVESERVFTIHSSDLGLSVLIPAIARDLKSKAPHTRVHAISVGEQELAAGLTSGVIDLAFGAVSFRHESGIYQRRLYTERYLSLVCADHPLSRGGALDFEKFQQQMHIVVSAGNSGHLHGRAESLLLAAIPPQNVAIRVPSFVLAAMLLRNTDYVLTIPSVAARALADEFHLTFIPCPIDLPGFTVTQYWHERFLDDPALRWLRMRVHELFRDNRGQAQMVQSGTVNVA